MERHFCVESERETELATQMEYFSRGCLRNEFLRCEKRERTVTSLRFAKFLADDEMKLKVYCLVGSNHTKPKNLLGGLRENRESLAIVSRMFRYLRSTAFIKLGHPQYILQVWNID